MNEEMIDVLNQENKHRTQHPFWVWESINSIPDLLSECLKGETQQDIQKIVNELIKRNVNKFIFLGRGSSYFAALSAKFLFEKVTNFPVICEVSNVFDSYPYSKCDSKTAVLFFSHSGKSEGDIQIVEKLREQGAFIIGVTDIPDSGLGKAVDQLLIGPGGSKVELPATRTYVTAIYRTMLLAVSLAKTLDLDSEIGFYQDLLMDLPEEIRSFMSSFENEAPSVVELLKDVDFQLIVGFGPNFPNAEEGAMAFNQSSGVPTLSYELENYIHGPMQALTSKAGVIAIAPQGQLQNRAFSMITAARIIGAKTVLLAPKGIKVPKVDYLIEMPSNIVDLISPVAYIVPLWQIGYHYGLLGHGTHPDRLSMDKPEFKEAFSYIMQKDKWVTKV